MADINTIKLPSNISYPLVDKDARTIMRKNGARNYLPINGEDTTENGLSITFSEDGSFVLNGTTTAQTSFTLYSSSDYLIENLPEDVTYCGVLASDDKD